jgi:Cu+-exporting ATPase
MVPDHFKEIIGAGIQGFVSGRLVRLGTCEFVTGKRQTGNQTSVYVGIDNEIFGRYRFKNHYRQSIPSLIKKLKRRYRLSVVSGDNESERSTLEEIMRPGSDLLFNQKPEDKLQYIKSLQRQGKKVMMIGDGLNDAGALRQSDAGIAVSEQTNNFTPASDAIVEAKQLPNLDRFIDLCKANKYIVIASFTLSIVYNIIGLFFAVQGRLSPLVAAILMPSSSLSILLVTFGSSNLLAKWLKL